MKKLLFLMAGISAMLLGSCSQEWGGGKNPTHDGNALALTVNVKETGSSATTRVAASPEEKTIASLYLLFFEPEANGEGRFVDYIEVTDIKATGEEHSINMTGTQLNLTEAYDILAIANIKGPAGAHYLNNMSIEAWMQQWADKTRQQVIETARAWTTNAPIDPEALLMSGSTKKEANKFKVDLTLVRNQIRFDVINKIKDHEMVFVGIYNAYQTAKIWNDGSSRGALDYSDSQSRIESYYNYSGNQLESRFDPKPLGSEEIHGHLYVFENQVAQPTPNDKLTTCLIVGLEAPSGDITYYRINIAPEKSPQMLYSNHAYILTINSVVEPGNGSPIEALDNPENPKLNYVINQWDVADVHISQQDGSSMLSAPYKLVNLDLFTGHIAGRAERGLDPRSFDITTVSSKPASEITPLAIIGEPTFHLNGSETPYDGIKVALRGNTLVFTDVRVAPDEPVAGSLQSGDKITGSITLGYAGLRITIQVAQTDLVRDFINIYLPESGIPRFAPFAGIESGVIRVEASGPWSAKILSENGGFGFAHDGSLNITSRPVSDHEFSVKTMSNNPDNRKAREAFVVVTLDKDPWNYSKMVRLTQQQKAEIAITPNQTVTFDGTFDGTSGNLASIPNNTIDTFTVLPGNIGEPGSETQNEWTYCIEAPDPNNADVWVTTYIEEGVGNIPEGVQNASLNWFKVTANHDTAIEGVNNFTVDVLGKNTTGANRRSRVVAYLKSSGYNGAKAAISVVQNTSSISLSPSTVPAVTKIGGESAEVSIQADATLKWKVESVSVDYGGTRAPVKHLIEVLSGSTRIASVDGNTVEVADGEYAVSDKFRVKFPKIYYPNRGIPMTVTVKVGIVGSSLTSTMVFTQTALNSPGFYPAAAQTGGYGNIHGGSYNRYLREGIRGMGTVLTGLNVNTNFYYSTTYGMTPAETWPISNNFRDTRDGLTMIVSDYDSSPEVGALNNTFSPLAKANFQIMDNNGTSAVFNTGASSTKLYKMLVSGEAGVLPAISVTANLYEDGICTQAFSYPAGSVPIIIQSGTTRAFMVIDPKSRLIFLGESQIFDTVEGIPFAQNLMVYIKNAAMYGSHFTDLLLDDENALPAPWDATYWGANAGVSR